MHSNNILYLLHLFISISTTSATTHTHTHIHISLACVRTAYVLHRVPQDLFPATNVQQLECCRMHVNFVYIIW